MPEPQCLRLRFCARSPHQNVLRRAEPRSCVESGWEATRAPVVETLRYYDVADAGTDPLWRHSGGELYYRNGDKMMVVEVRTQPSFTAGRPRLLWEGHYSHGMSSSCGAPGVTSFNYDVTADGQRFLMVKDVHQDVASNKIQVVLNWTEELKRMAARKQ